MRKLKLLLARAITRLAWQLGYRRRPSAGYVPVLCYHRVLPELLEDENNPVYTLLPEQFEAQLAFLVQEGFVSLSLDEFGEMARGLKPAPSRVVLLTFDDGYADFHAVAWPLAQKYNVKLNLFISTGLIGQSGPVIMTQNGYRFHSGEGPSLYYQGHLEKFPHLWRPLTWEEVREMGRTGVGFGLHGHTHRNLVDLDKTELVEELSAGVRAFRHHLGYSPRFFALPYGDYGKRVFPRICIHQQDSLETLRMKLLGAYDWLETVGHFLRRAKGLGA